MKEAARSGFYFRLALAIAVTLLAASCHKKDAPAVQTAPGPVDPVVATINDETVTAAEYRLVMERKTAGVFGYFKEHENMDDHPGYWSESTGPEGPLARLRKVVQEELVRIKVIQGLAQKKGLIGETSFARFKAGFDRENARRSAAKQAGEVIYGPTQYRVAAYYYICLGELDYKLKEALAKEAEAGVMKSDIEKYYKENQAILKETPLDDELQRRIRLVLAHQQAEKELASLRASAQVEMKDNLLSSIVPRKDPEEGAPGKGVVLQN